MANLIILEGVSRTGKTSIAERLKDKFPIKSISLQNKKPDYINDYADFYHGMHLISNCFYSEFKNETFILDRSFMSELVYSRAFNRKTHIDREFFIYDLLNKNNFILINLSTTHKKYIERNPKEGIQYTEEEFNQHKDLFYWYYDYYKNKSRLLNWTSRFRCIDSNEFSIDECVKIISKLIEEKIYKK